MTPKFFLMCGWRVADCIVADAVLPGEGRVRSAQVYVLWWRPKTAMWKVYLLLELNRRSKTTAICLSMGITSITELFLIFQIFLLTCCNLLPPIVCHKSTSLVHLLGREKEYYELALSGWVLSLDSVITCQNPSVCRNVDASEMKELPWSERHSVVCSKSPCRWHSFSSPVLGILYLVSIEEGKILFPIQG